MKKLMFIVSLFWSMSLMSQAVFILESIPPETPEEDHIYMAGGFNGWNPGDVNHRLNKNGNDQWEIILDGFPDGISIEYKFTRGSWETVEKGPSGEEIPNRGFTFGNGDTVFVTIQNWADLISGTSTAAENVHIMDPAFWMPQLSRTRTIWVYLPPGYESTDERYPVLYMHDAQNLFDNITSFAGEWEVDESLNELAGQGYNVPIVVGINHGGTERINELTPWINPLYGGGMGDKYLAFIVETLKPHVDTNYRTMPGREHTGIMGSSLGGLISAYGALKYQDVFGRSGPYSPSYWFTDDSLFLFVSNLTKEHDLRFYQAIGGDESQNSIQLLHNMEDSLNMAGFQDITSLTVEGYGHNEVFWRNDFPAAYLWLFSDYAYGIKETNIIKPLSLYPNPATDAIFLKDFDIMEDELIQVLDSSGKVCVEQYGGKMVELSNLSPGYYFLRIAKNGSVYLGKFVKQ
ncbi:MAG: alpha/beta hydrolase-fold protein [Bacteroidales bacterium]|nr:alpha/beta hydrolase-fold protein [Bacteroidales bacterium]